MLQTPKSYNGMVVAPHHLASQAGLAVLREGGSAIEAMVAAASTIAVVYPHMNGLGGDNFWLIRTPDGKVNGIDACGAAAGLADIDWYKDQAHQQIPDRGPLAAVTVAGAVSGWQRALELGTSLPGKRIPLQRLLADAIGHAKNGVAVTATLADNAAGKRDQLQAQPGFADVYLPGGKPVAEGTKLLQERIASSLEQLVSAGLDDYYRGDLAASISADLQAIGSPLRREDLERHRALDVDPLVLKIREHSLYNMPPPTQGLASLLLLGVFDRLQQQGVAPSVDSFDYVHALVESTKASFKIRDRYVTDPQYMEQAANSFLTDDVLQELVASVDLKKAAPWPQATGAGDTVWLGAIDKNGCAVSFIQSVFWEFGSGCILPQSGITWQNRGTSFSLDAAHHNCLKPLRRPFHTIQPAMAELGDGRVMPYGTMGGEGQPQTQAMVFSRYVHYGQSLQQSVTAPRWLLGKTWGSEKTNLRIEQRFAPEVYQQLLAAGHDVEQVGEFEEFMGHAGALVLHTKGDRAGVIEGAADPRSDGSVAAC